MIGWLREQIGTALYWSNKNQGNLVGTIALCLIANVWFDYEASKGCVPFESLGEVFIGGVWPVILESMNAVIALAHADIISTIIVLYLGLFFIGSTVSFFFFLARIVAWPILIIAMPAKLLIKASLRMAVFKFEELAGQFIDLNGYWEPSKVRLWR